MRTPSAATRAVSGEGENGCIRALLMSPIDRAALYAAKLAAAFIFMAVAEAASIILMVLFFNLEFDAKLMRLAPAVLLGALGFAALATLLAGISSRLRGGDLVLPLLAVPMFVPALIAGVKASAATLAGTPIVGRHYQASVPGLYFIGPVVAPTFGPVIHALTRGELMTTVRLFLQRALPSGHALCHNGS